MVDAKARSEAPKWRYRAFLSYSRVDDRAAKWLHKSLENYILPKGLAERNSYLSNSKNWFVPIFRDRTDLSSGGDLVEKLREALDQSQYLILLCSPASAQSEIVNAEVEHFVANGRLDSVFPLIVSGEPYSGDPETECIPPALRAHNIIAADMRDIKLENGKQIGDGKDGAKFKLIAGMLGVSLDNLLQRERRKANRRAAFQTALSFVFLALAAVAGGAAWMAYLSEQEAQRQRATAEASSDFLIDMFEAGIPNRQNPNEVTARTILDRGARRINSEFADQPEIRANLIRMISHAYLDLGALDAGIELIESSDVSNSNAGREGIHAQVLLARLYLQSFQYEKSESVINSIFEQLQASNFRSEDLEAFAIETLALIHLDNGDYDQALSSFDDAIDTYANQEDHDPLMLVAPISHRAGVLSDTGEFEGALSELRKARQILLDGQKDNSLDLARVNYMLALNSYNSYAYNTGVGYITEAKSTFQELLEPNNIILGDVYTLEGELHFELGDNVAARASLAKALEIYDSAFDGLSSDFGPAYFYLALVESAEGKNTEALRYFEQAEEAFRSHPQPDEYNLASLAIERSGILFDLGRSADAEKICTQALATLEELLRDYPEEFNGFAERCDR